MQQILTRVLQASIAPSRWISARDLGMTLSFNRDGIDRLSRALKRRWAGSAPSYLYGNGENAFARLGGGGRSSFRLLLISDRAEYTSEQQFAPMVRHQMALRRTLGLVFRRIPLDRALVKPDSFFRGFDAVGLKMSFRTSEARVESVLCQLEAKMDRTRTKAIYFDGDDDQSVQWYSALEWCDLYVKKHAFQDREMYSKTFCRVPTEIKSNNLTDYIASLAGPGRDEDTVPASCFRSASHLHKLHVGWNIALDDKISELAARTVPAPPVRDIDILCRAFVPSEAWIAPMRNAALDAIEQLSNRFTILAPRNRVPQSEYDRELARSRICVSPIGYGELCWRDFEAIMSGCLLMKPDVSYLATNPNIFVPHSTFVPVKWDYSDLKERCDFYLRNEGERLAIVANARRVLLSALSEDWFLGAISTLLQRLREPTPRSRAMREIIRGAVDERALFPVRGERVAALGAEQRLEKLDV